MMFLETLGVTDKASSEEIDAAYENMKKYYDPAKFETEPTLKIFFDDLTLAYNTLINKASREEYDDYIESHR